jgi:hypothetical protein
MTVSDRIRIQNVRVLFDNHYVLKTTTSEWRRPNGEWQTQHRETYDRGNGAALLRYNLAACGAEYFSVIRTATPVRRHLMPPTPVCVARLSSQVSAALPQLVPPRSAKSTAHRHWRRG